MIKYIAPMVFYNSNFQNYLKGDLHQFIDDLEENRKKLKEISGYTFDNSYFRFDNIYGTEFSFHINEKSIWNSKERKFDKLGIFDIGVWDYTGRIHVFDGKIPNENRNEFINDLFSVCEKWSKGEKKCDDCGKWINYQENKSHRYFAATYCTECWERKWKAVEAAENYN
jgi:hypothetical protein